MKNNNVVSLAVRTALFSTAFFTLQAAYAGPQHENMLAQFDLNADGVITSEEIASIREADFKLADTDGNGFLSLDEFTALKQAKEALHIKELYTQMDSSGDNNVKLDEFAAFFPGPADMAEKVFLELSGPDSSLTLEEFTAAHMAKQDATRLSELVAWEFALLDQDADKQLSVEEFTKPAKPPVATPPKKPEQPQKPEKPVKPVKPAKPTPPTKPGADEAKQAQLKAQLAMLDKQLQALDTQKTQLQAQLEKVPAPVKPMLTKQLERLEKQIAELQKQREKLQALLTP